MFPPTDLDILVLKTLSVPNVCVKPSITPSASPVGVSSLSPPSLTGNVTSAVKSDCPDLPNVVVRTLPAIE